MPSLPKARRNKNTRKHRTLRGLLLLVYAKTIDYLGPFPDDGYVLTIIDTFTRWTELYHTLAATAEEAAKKLLQHVGRFGVPAQIVSDRGSHFVNKVIKEFFSMVGTKHVITIAYSKQENSMVERQHKEINRHIRGLIFEANNFDYEATLPIVQRIINSTTNSSTKVPPSDLLFGKAINLNQRIFLLQDEIPLQDNQPLSVRHSTMINTQERLLAYAAQNLIHNDKKHGLQSENLKIRTEFPVDSYVLVAYPNGPPTRLNTLWKGPLQVVNIDKAEYTLRNLVTQKSGNSEDQLLSHQTVESIPL